MKTQKGFIQIPLLIAIIAGVLALGGVGYIGVKYYQTQQKELEKNKKEIVALQKSVQQSALSSDVPKQKIGFHPVILPPQSPNISAKDISSYLNGVVEITCYDTNGNLMDTGSGVLKRYPTNFNVLTNEHVVGNLDCDFAIEGPGTGQYTLPMSGRGSFNKYADASLAKIGFPRIRRDLSNDTYILSNANPPDISSLNYSIGDLKHCQTEMPIGSPVIVIGYPATGMLAAQGNTNYQIPHQIVTLGTISGYDGAPYSSGLPDVNYFVTAQMDAGNSGGATIAKDDSGLCFLGLPTWINQGKYANTGIVQSINNVMYQK